MTFRGEKTQDLKGESIRALNQTKIGSIDRETFNANLRESAALRHSSLAPGSGGTSLPGHIDLPSSVIPVGVAEVQTGHDYENNLWNAKDNLKGSLFIVANLHNSLPSYFG
jgi:hypothetical protein